MHGGLRAVSWLALQERREELENLLHDHRYDAAGIGKKRRDYALVLVEIEDRKKEARMEVGNEHH